MTSIRQQINIDATPRQVWRALTTSEGLKSWWVDEARVDAREGGRVVLIGEGDEGEPIEERGIFHSFRPMRRIEIAWDSNSPSPNRGTRIQFSVARDGEETRLHLIHSGKGILEDEEAWPTLQKEWRQALLALRTALEGE
jgi:uncharacterized protein YndB with AHSA1/START domain